MTKNCENITNGFNESKYEKQMHYAWSRTNTFNGHELNRVRVQISDNLDVKNWDCIVKTRSKEEFPLIYSCEDSTSDSSSVNLCDIQCKQSAKRPMENQDMEIEETWGLSSFVISDKAYARQRQFLAANKASEMHIEESKGSLDSNQKNTINSDRKDNVSSDRKDNVSSDRRDNVSSDRRDNVSSDRRDNIRSFSSNYLSKMSCCKRLMFLPLTVIVVLSIAVYMSENQDRKHSSDFASAVIELKRIHGQDALIFDLSKYLLSDTPRLKIIILIGGTGVGKSYTVEIIKKNFPRKYSIRQYFPPIRTGFEFNIPFLQPGLIIIENLKERDLMDVAKFFKRYQDTYKDKLATVLAVFNFDVSSYPNIRKIENIFNEDISKDIRFFYYLPLDENALSMCIMDAIVESGLTLSENKFAAVKRSLIQNNAGCKRAYNKVQIYGTRTIKNDRTWSS
ncbi:uncharacterized protein LOC143893222 [Temnothorax americanus]|uniref:uncharacterized protein LOC143893222 n=1 Tax=Temnothorax americanus TaxID=1964332 RepID=UPI0040685DE1